ATPARPRATRRARRAREIDRPRFARSPRPCQLPPRDPRPRRPSIYRPPDPVRVSGGRVDLRAAERRESAKPGFGRGGDPAAPIALFAQTRSPMMRPLCSADDIRRPLSLRDLTDPAAGAHAMQRLIDDLVAALSARWGCATSIHRASPVVDVADNYDRLHYPEGGAARDARYTRYLTDRLTLRREPAARIPPG